MSFASGGQLPMPRRWWRRLLPLALTLTLACASAGPRPAAAPVPGPATPAAPGPQPTRTLFVALDAIPYQVVAEATDPALGEGALFPGFKDPIPLVSTFPSTTSLAMTGLFEPFGLDKPPGYEARFFDWRFRKVRGGMPWNYHQIPFAWRDFFDWKIESIVRKAIGYIRPSKFGDNEVEKAIDAFVASDKLDFFVYIGATDAIGHLMSPDALKETLAHLDQTLRRVRARHPHRPFHAVLFSDHGMGGDSGEYLKNVQQGVKLAMREAGFKIGRRARSPRHVVFVPYGLISSFIVFSDPARDLEVGRALATVEGVDLCAVAADGGWRITSARGEALVLRRETDHGDLWSYRPEGGDPLGYLPLVESLRARSHDPQREWFPDHWWFEASWQSYYPDALYRLARSFDLVQNPASVVCSCAEGFMFGQRMVEYAAIMQGRRLRWTHGALDRDASLGFLLTDHPDWVAREAERFDRALYLFAHGPRAAEDKQIAARH